MGRCGLALTAALLGACFARAGGRPPNAYQQAEQQQHDALTKPKNPGTTAAQWQQAESQATKLARQPGGKLVLPATRLTRRDKEVQLDLSVKANHCYQAGVAWAFARKASVNVAFLKGPDGKSTSQAYGVRGFTLEATGPVAFCADNDGKVRVSIRALTSFNALANKELHEYAVAVGEIQESAGQTAQRRRQERQKMDATRARYAQNIANAKARERRVLARLCRRCKLEFIQCLQARQIRRRGVTIQATCDSLYVLCSYGGSYHEARKRPNQRPCGPPPL